jgi:hypothetical protein
MDGVRIPVLPAGRGCDPRAAQRPSSPGHPTTPCAPPRPACRPRASRPAAPRGRRASASPAGGTPETDKVLRRSYSPRPLATGESHGVHGKQGVCAATRMRHFWVGPGPGSGRTASGATNEPSPPGTPVADHASWARVPRSVPKSAPRSSPRSRYARACARPPSVRAPRAGTAPANRRDRAGPRARCRTSAAAARLDRGPGSVSVRPLSSSPAGVAGGRSTAADGAASARVVPGTESAGGSTAGPTGSVANDMRAPGPSVASSARRTAAALHQRSMEGLLRAGAWSGFLRRKAERRRGRNRTLRGDDPARVPPALRAASGGHRPASSALLLAQSNP